MLRIALRSLTHDRSRFIAALVGVSFAGLLATEQNALYEGFLYTTSSIITRLGGDVWVTARGVRVFDNVEPISGGTRSLVSEPACVQRVRPLVFAFSWLRTDGGSRETVRVVGTDGGEPFVPWTLVRGLPGDLDAPLRVAVDELDLARLGIHGEPLGHGLAIMNRRAYVAALTRGARSFTLLPFIFARTEEARRLTPLGEGQVDAWVLDLSDPSCVPAVVAAIGEHPELEARSTETLRAQTQAFWLRSSGAGAILAFSALMGLLVGGVIVGQTLFASVRDYEPELATLRAIGASPWEVAGFVGWQVGLLMTLGGGLGMGAAVAMGALARRGGLETIFSPLVLAKSAGVLLLMAAAASAMSLRRVLRIESRTSLSMTAEVLRAERLSKQFESGGSAVPVVRAVDFVLRSGELTLLMGPSGSGKTTLLSMLAGLLRPSSGSIHLLGCALEHADERTLTRLRRHQVGFVFQRDNLFPALSAQDNVAEVLGLKGMKRGPALASAAKLLGRVGLSQRLRHLPAQLSGGQRQRVAIARALAGAPRLIFGDEVTAALDGQAAFAVMELLADFVRRDTAALLVTHDPRLMRFAHRVLEMEDGVIIRDEPGGRS